MLPPILFVLVGRDPAPLGSAAGLDALTTASLRGAWLCFGGSLAYLLMRAASGQLRRVWGHDPASTDAISDARSAVLHEALVVMVFGGLTAAAHAVDQSLPPGGAIMLGFAQVMAAWRYAEVQGALVEALRNARVPPIWDCLLDQAIAGTTRRSAAYAGFGAGPLSGIVLRVRQALTGRGPGVVARAAEDIVLVGLFTGALSMIVALGGV